MNKKSKTESHPLDAQDLILVSWEKLIPQATLEAIKLESVFEENTLFIPPQLQVVDHTTYACP